MAQSNPLRYFWLLCQQVHVGSIGRPPDHHWSDGGHHAACRTILGAPTCATVSRCVQRGASQHDGDLLPVVDRLDPQTSTSLQLECTGFTAIRRLDDLHKERQRFHRWLRQQNRFIGLPCLPDLVSGTEVEFIEVDGHAVVIGRGQYGVVCLARSVYTHRLLAVKVLFRERCLGTDVVYEGALLQAVKLTLTTPSFHGIGFLQLQDDSKYWNYCLVTDFIADPQLQVSTLGSYVTALRSRSYFCERLSQSNSAVYLDEILTLIVDVVKGLCKIHERKVVVNDVKLDNILLHMDRDAWKPLFIDFGMAKLGDYGVDYSIPATEQGKLEFLQTYQQVAPEVVYTGTCSMASDVYSLGWLLLYLSQQLLLPAVGRLGHSCLAAATRRPTAEQILAELCTVRNSVGPLPFLAWIAMLKDRRHCIMKHQTCII